MATPDRSQKFEAWLRAGLTDEKIKMLVDMEKSTRLFLHVLRLIGEADPKLAERLLLDNLHIQESYEQE